MPDVTIIAREAGYDHGKAAGSWAIDGNTPDNTVKQIWQGIQDGDPVILDMQPAPLSGEWAGESIPELSEEYGIDLTEEDVADAFEDGFYDGYWQEVEATCIARLGEEVTAQ